MWGARMSQLNVENCPTQAKRRLEWATPTATIDLSVNVKGPLPDLAQRALITGELLSLT